MSFVRQLLLRFFRYGAAEAKEMPESPSPKAKEASDKSRIGRLGRANYHTCQALGVCPRIVTRMDPALAVRHGHSFPHGSPVSKSFGILHFCLIWNSSLLKLTLHSPIDCSHQIVVEACS